MKWTKEQQRVIDERGNNILVSAAAGSGKTAVLCERILQRITDKNDPLSLDRLLVMTFTKAAAAEMKERINKSLSERLLSEQDPKIISKLRLQRALLPSARIATIDSICSSLIKEYYQELAIDPSFRTAEEGELRLIRAEVQNELLEEKFAEGNEEFLALCESLSGMEQGEKLSELIERVYNFSDGDPWSDEFLKERLSECEKESAGELSELLWFKRFFKDIEELALGYKSKLGEALCLCYEAGGPISYAESIEQDIDFCESLSRIKDYEKLYSFVQSYTSLKLKAARGKDLDPLLKLKVKASIDDFRDWLSSLKNSYLLLPKEELLLTLKGSGRHISELIRLALEFQRRFAEEKRERGVIDFSDMEHLCLKILYKEENGEKVPSEIADELAQRFDEILIDEYQDSNSVQEALLNALSAERFGRHDVFCVGDVKQSIYRFRLARPELFMEKYESYKRVSYADDESETGSEEAAASSEKELEAVPESEINSVKEEIDQINGIKIELNKNFRSRAEVLSSVNAVFGSLMHKSLGGIEYDEHSALYKGADFPECGDEQSFKTELYILNTEKTEDFENRSNTEYEAMLTAEIIRELVNEAEPGKSFKIYDRELDALRPATYKDIVILFRSPQRRAESYIDVLQAAGIPAYTESAFGYFSAGEVETVLSLLEVIDNPRRDIELTAVMKSPIGAFSDEELARIKAEFSKELSRIACGESDNAEVLLHEFYDALLYCAASETADKLFKKCSDFLAMLSRFRAFSEILSVNQLLDCIYDETGYYDYVSALPLGKSRRKNLDMLLRRAEIYAEAGIRSLSGFVRYIELLKKYNSDYGEQSSVSEADDIVRISSIHRSKGLEYPIVILADTGSSFNRSEKRENLIMDSDYGMAMDYVDIAAHTKYPSLKRLVLLDRLSEESLSEELRILYVAMTRAKEKLIITGVDKHLSEDSFEEYKGGYTANDELLFKLRLKSAGSFLSLLLMSGALRRDGEIELKLKSIYELEDLSLAREADERESLDRLMSLNEQEEIDSAYLKKLCESVNAVYAFDKETRLKPKLSVSELKAAGYDRDFDFDDGRAYEEGFAENVMNLSLGAASETASEVPTSVTAVSEIKADTKSDTPGGSSYGNSFHRLMQLFDFGALKEETDIAALVNSEISRISGLKRMQKSELELIKLEDIEGFLKTELAMRMAEAQRRGELFREQRFMAAFPARELDKSVDSSEPQLLQGIIDAYFETGEGSLVIVDYKTDRLYEEDSFKERYALQLELYKKALSKLCDKPVASTYIYSTALKRYFSV